MAKIPVHPMGPRVCTCRYPHFLTGELQFVCDEPIDGEDGLCTSCREALDCTEARRQIAETIAG